MVLHRHEITCLARRIERKFFIIYSLFCLQRNNESIFIHFRFKKKFRNWIFNFSFELNVFKFDRNWWIDKKYFLFLKYFYFHFVTNVSSCFTKFEPMYLSLIRKLRIIWNRQIIAPNRLTLNDCKKSNAVIFIQFLVYRLQNIRFIEGSRAT